MPIGLSRKTCSRTEAGMHRFLWDVRYSAPPVAQPGYSMFTVAGRDVPREPAGPQALPGSYQVRLTVDGKTYTQPFKLTMDPRVKTTPQDLEKQFSLELKLVQTLQQANQAVDDIHAAAQAGKISADDEKKLAGARRRRGEAEPEGAPSAACLRSGNRQSGSTHRYHRQCGHCSHNPGISGRRENSVPGAGASTAMGGIKAQVACRRQT